MNPRFLGRGMPRPYIHPFAHSPISMLFSILAGACSGLGAVSAVYAQEYVATARRIDTPLTLDGILNDEAWQTTPPVITSFIQQRPDEGQPASQRTTVRVVYDATNIYFGIMCYDTQPEGMVATEMRRDADLTDDDFIEIILDTFHDRQNGFLFSTNPTGARFDAQVRNEGAGVNRGFRSSTGRPFTSENYNVDWDGVWTTHNRMLPDGWSIEMAIPFTTLRFEKGERVTFGLNIQRQIRRRNEQAFWAPVPRPYTIFKVSSAGQLTGLQLPEPERNLKLKPFMITGAQNDYTRTDSRRTDGKLDGGGDLKYGLTPNMTLDVTFNTDFSQVESDVDQVNLTQFSLFFPEKREFFLENAGLFTFGSSRTGPTRETEMFFSRRIGLFDVAPGDTREVPIIGGARVTGKAGRFNVGVMNITTDETTFLKTDSTTVFVPRTNFTIARMSRDIFAKSNVGFIAMNKQEAQNNRYNRLVSADMNLNFGDHFTSNGTLVGSFTGSNQPIPDGDGVAGLFSARWQTELYQLQAGYRNTPDDFNNEFGFIRRPGVIAYDTFTALTYEPKAHLIRQHFPHITFTYQTDQQNEQVSRREHYGYTVFLRDGTQTELAVNRQLERVDPGAAPILGIPLTVGRHAFTDVFLTFTSNQSKALFGGFRATAGEFFDGHRRQFAIDGGLRFGSKFNIQPSYEFNDVSLTNGDERVHLVTARVVYSFSPRLSTRALIQWNSFRKEINTNFRLRFLTTPGSDMFIVYNERRATDDMVFPAASIDGFGVRNRTVALKFTYLFEL